MLNFPQNNRTPAWQGLAGPSGDPPVWPPAKQGHPEQGAQHRVQAGLEYLQRRRLHSLPGQPGPGLRHPQSEEVLPQCLPSIVYYSLLSHIKLPEPGGAKTYLSLSDLQFQSQVLKHWKTEQIHFFQLLTTFPVNLYLSPRLNVSCFLFHFTFQLLGCPIMSLLS